MSKHFARMMRRRMTDAETRLWVYLRPLRRQGLAFRRQSPVDRYILDFECRKAKLAIEVDGPQHDAQINRDYDLERSARLQALGYEVLRYWNADVLAATDTIVEHIVRTAKLRAASISAGRHYP